MKIKYFIKILISIFIIGAFLNMSVTAYQDTNSGTINKNQTNIFKLEGVNVIYNNELKLLFNNPLYKMEGLPIDIKITDKVNPLNTIIIDTTTISGSTLNVKLKTLLNTNNEYKMVIIEIFDINGDIIGKGVNAFKIFNTPKVFDTPSLKVNSGSIELNAASDVNINNLFKNIIPDTKVTNSKKNNILETAKKSKKLPNTGPAEWILLIAALFFGIIFFVFKSKYKNG